MRVLGGVHRSCLVCRAGGIFDGIVAIRLTGSMILAMSLLDKYGQLTFSATINQSTLSIGLTIFATLPSRHTQLLASDFPPLFSALNAWIRPSDTGDSSCAISLTLTLWPTVLTTR
jgi:hypothetical protein